MRAGRGVLHLRGARYENLSPRGMGIAEGERKLSAFALEPSIIPHVGLRRYHAPARQAKPRL
jgi:hypothetical protein